MLIAATVWWPLSARLALRFIEREWSVSALCPPGHPLRHTPGVASIHAYRPLRSLASLEAALARAEPDLIVPCDDRVVWQLHELHRLRPRWRPLIEHSLGPAAFYELIDSREHLLAEAAALGLNVPSTSRVASADDLRAWLAATPGRAVLKLDGTWGGEGVQIVDSEAEALEVFRRFSSPPGLPTAIKRLAVNSDPLAFWDWRRRRGAITAQKFVEGRPANAMFAAWRGELLGIVCVDVLASQGETGAAVMVRLIENHEMEEAARLLAARLSLSGFAGLDFILEGATGRAWLIEMNPRCTQLGHLSLPRQGDLVGLLLAKLNGKAPPRIEPAIEDEVIAFFPMSATLKVGDRSPGVHQDIPLNCPTLVQELLEPPWPERRLISRLYHRIRPPRVIRPTTFENEKRDRHDHVAPAPFVAPGKPGPS